MTLRMIDTFSGIGGFSLAARWLGGIETVQFVEREPYCRHVLRKHWPDVPIHDDICTFNPAPGSADIICGGFPCQDISTAGKQAGIKEGTRSGLFYELMRVVRLVGPRYVVLENVAAITSNGMDTVLGTLAEAGFDAEWACIPASAVGACHRRDRWWQAPTPVAQTGQGGAKGLDGGSGARQMLADAGFPRAAGAPTALPTPRANDAEKRGNFDPTNPRNGLPAAVKLLPTPRAGETSDRTSTPGNRFSLSAWASRGCSTLPTPTTRDHKGKQSPGHKERGYGTLLPDALIPTGEATYLNPSFVEEMMGFPVGWTV